jgi:signal transduction histidine kinase
LSIRERLDLLGGKLEIESAAGRGSRFALMVPLNPA